MENNKKIKIRNRTSGTVLYSVPDLHIRREFAPREEKVVSFEELERLSYQPGGLVMLQHYLVIDDIEARTSILGEVELEYAWTEQDVKNMLLHGSLNQLLDCLDFAPAGVLELVKDLAIKLELNDLSKRGAIDRALGCNITNAIAINKETNEETESVKENLTILRRTQIQQDGIVQEHFLIQNSLLSFGLI